MSEHFLGVKSDRTNLWTTYLHLKSHSGPAAQTVNIRTVLALSTVIGLPIQTLYPAMNGPLDKAPEVLTKLFSPDANKEPFTIVWSRMGPVQRPIWTANHFVPVFRHGTTEDLIQNTEHFKPNDIRTPVTDQKSNATFVVKDNIGVEFMVTYISKSSLYDQY
ncbi:hypothetical protein CHS0354_011617 [Potamilus streckersoni]|uniref:Uncharacterized protein n=1 Tax=Potamilus streckersoni TaxID=2493646 RepID=A0AAE0TL50_9BIVA|nr:hypothetical protein CHS0354_011617 [Potamilus streckersoni]